MTNYFEQDLKKAKDFHGHVCQGIIFGSRIARAGLNYLSINDPAENRDFTVFVEADRCIADAVCAVTDCSLGKRRLRWIDYGKMAATFIDMNTNKGIRIVVTSKLHVPKDGDIVSFWREVPNNE